VPKALV